jgi:hypothetical protein
MGKHVRVFNNIQTFFRRDAFSPKHGTTDGTDGTDGKGVFSYPCHPCHPWFNFWVAPLRLCRKA